MNEVLERAAAEERADVALWGLVEAIDGLTDVMLGTTLQRETVRLHGDSRGLRRLLEDLAAELDALSLRRAM